MNTKLAVYGEELFPLHSIPTTKFHAISIFRTSSIRRSPQTPVQSWSGNLASELYMHKLYASQELEVVRNIFSNIWTSFCNKKKVFERDFRSMHIWNSPYKERGLQTYHLGARWNDTIRSTNPDSLRLNPHCKRACSPVSVNIQS